MWQRLSKSIAHTQDAGLAICATACQQSSIGMAPDDIELISRHLAWLTPEWEDASHLPLLLYCLLAFQLKLMEELPCITLKVK